MKSVRDMRKGGLIDKLTTNKILGAILRESARTTQGFPILRSIPLQEHYYPLFRHFSPPKKVSASLPNGKPKGKNYNLIKN